MTLKALYIKKTFHFNFDARTSRGQMEDKISWFIKIWDERDRAVVGIGECGPLPGLSIDHRPDFEEKLSATLDRLENFTSKDIASPQLSAIVPSGFPSITFAMETALQDLSNGGKRIIRNNQFVKGLRIPINGLVWMGDFDFMLRQIEDKISKGFTCIKLKVGGIDFDLECELLGRLRRKFPKDRITLRLDANGAFTAENVMQRLHTLSQFGIHSIEQPLKAGLPRTQDVCSESTIPVALDEELIGLENRENKEEMLDRLKPQFIVIKPSLHGGLSGSSEWIGLAENRGIGWWITSALESNIGLNAICQFTADYPVSMHQGLGTGMIYQRNIPSPLSVADGAIFMNPQLKWDLAMINEE
ncbi:MAG TPA: o-succinylbenzoate synthase [Chryseolinea sp.]|nr:o-succinylbenzoate synthase [Chryseolinea sp.]